MIAGAVAIPLPNKAGVLIGPGDGAPAFLVPVTILDRLVHDDFAVFENSAYRATDAGQTQSGL